MAAHSTIPSARAALLAALEARPALAQVQVSYSHPGDARETESVYLGEARGASEIPVIRAARKKREERYTIDVWFDVAGDGPTAQGASARAYELYGELEDVLADDPTLGLPAPFWAVVGDFTETMFFDEARRGYGSLLRVGVNCVGRLT